jgi:hypothetical protein
MTPELTFNLQAPVFSFLIRVQIRIVRRPSFIRFGGNIVSLKIGLENGMEGRSIVWVLDHLGCFSYGSQSNEALGALPAAVHEYNQWLQTHGKESWQIPINQAPFINGIWEVYQVDENYVVADEGYEVNAWFQDDWRPLSEAEIEHGIDMLDLTRKDLLLTVSGLDEDSLNVYTSADNWSIAQILNHVGNADWWYLDRLGLAFPRNEMATGTFRHLEKVRDYLVGILSNMAGSKHVVGLDGEFWSPRKLLRRAVWHERDHTFHIKEILPS